MPFRFMGLTVVGGGKLSSCRFGNLAEDLDLTRQAREIVLSHLEGANSS